MLQAAHIKHPKHNSDTNLSLPHSSNMTPSSIKCLVNAFLNFVSNALIDHTLNKASA